MLRSFKLKVADKLSDQDFIGKLYAGTCAAAMFGMAATILVAAFTDRLDTCGRRINNIAPVKSIPKLPQP